MLVVAGYCSHHNLRLPGHYTFYKNKNNSDLCFRIYSYFIILFIIIMKVQNTKYIIQFKLRKILIYILN